MLDTNGNEIAVPNGISSEKMNFNQDGTIGYYDNNGNFVNLNQTMAVYQFNNPAGLEKQSEIFLPQHLILEIPARGTDSRTYEK